MTCAHCDKQAEWLWIDPKGKELQRICDRCMDTVAPYAYSPLSQFVIIDSEGQATTSKGEE